MKEKILLPKFFLVLTASRFLFTFGRKDIDACNSVI